MHAEVRSSDNATAPATDRTRRSAALAVSLVVAIALNLVAISVFTGVAAKWRSAIAPARQTAWITTVAAPPPTASPAPEVEVGAPRVAAPEPQEAANAAEPQRRAIPRPDPKPTEAVTLSPPTRAAGPGDAATHRFYRFHEVDEPAMPESDWNFDAAFLDAAGLRRVVFEVYVNRSGEVVGCAILEPEELSAQTREAMEERLRQVILKPAMRAGLAVASVRRIELSVSSGPG